MNASNRTDGLIDFPPEIAGEGAPGDAVRNFIATLPTGTTHISLSRVASSLTGISSSDSECGVDDLVVSIAGKTPEEIESACQQRIGSLLAAKTIADACPLPAEFR